VNVLKGRVMFFGSVVWGYDTCVVQSGVDAYFHSNGSFFGGYNTLFTEGTANHVTFFAQIMRQGYNALPAYAFDTTTMKEMYDLLVYIRTSLVSCGLLGY
jgi:hypothetical protein